MRTFSHPPRTWAELNRKRGAVVFALKASDESALGGPSYHQKCLHHQVDDDDAIPTSFISGSRVNQMSKSWKYHVVYEPNPHSLLTTTLIHMEVIPTIEGSKVLPPLHLRLI